MSVTTTIVAMNEREMRVAVPDSLPANSPLVIALHPGLSDAERFQTHATLGLASALDTKSDVLGNKFLTIYPYGTGKVARQFQTWNCGWCCGVAHEYRRNDIQFLKDIIKWAELFYSIDTSKVYLAGYSNGAFLALSFVARNPTMVAGVVTAAGTLVMNYDEMEATINVPITMIHGTADTTVPLEGGNGALDESWRPAIADVIDAFEDRGATVTYTELVGATHSFSSIQAVLLSQESTDFATIVDEMVNP